MGTVATNISLTMSLFSLFFTVGPAIKLMMQEGRRITSEDFQELTPEQYEEFQKQGNIKQGKVFVLRPKNEEESSANTGKPIMFCDENEIPIFDEAWNYIESMSKKSSDQLLTDDEKLLCVAKTLPDVFIQGGPFAYVLDEREERCCFRSTTAK